MTSPLAICTPHPLTLGLAVYLYWPRGHQWKQAKQRLELCLGIWTCPAVLLA